MIESQAIFFKQPDFTARKRRREKAIMTLCGVVFLLISTAKIPVAVYFEVHALAFSISSGCAIAFVALFMLYRGSIAAGEHLLTIAILWTILWDIFGFFGPGGDFGGAVHYFLLPYIMAAHFASFEGRRSWVTVYSLFALVVFLIVEFELISFMPLVAIPEQMRELMHPFAISSSVITILLLTRIFVRQTDVAEAQLELLNARLEVLLENMLPSTVAKRLREQGRTFAEGFANCSIVFADIVGFTKMASRQEPEEVVAVLNRVFSRFDEATESIGLEKIKTIGDSYMAAAGVPADDPEHATKAMLLGIRMLEIVEEHPGLSVRVGINSGPVVAGVIGLKRFIYDLWGDAVNIASRMESQGVAGRIQVSGETHELLKDRFEFESRGTIPIKGKGEMEVFLFVGQKPTARSEEIRESHG